MRAWGSVQTSIAVYSRASNLWEPTCRPLQHRRVSRLQSLPWQLPQLLPSPADRSVKAGMPAIATSQGVATPVAAMAAPTSAAIACRSICGSWHAGDCNIAGCRDTGRCHGSSHTSRCHGSSHKCCHRPPINRWEPACRRLQHRRVSRLRSLPWQLPHQSLPWQLPHRSLPWQLPQRGTAAIASRSMPTAVAARVRPG